MPGAQWDRTLGSPAPTAADAAIAVGTDAMPVVAWSDSQSKHVLAARWDRSVWNALGGDIEASVSPVDSVQVSSVALSASGTPCVGWSGQQGVTSNGYVASWTASAWQALPSGQSGGIGTAAVRLDSKGNPIALFGGYIGVPRTVEAFQNGAWAPVDSEPGLLDVAVDGQDRPVALVSTTESNLGAFHLRVAGSSPAVEVTPTLPTGTSE